MASQNCLILYLFCSNSKERVTCQVDITCRYICIYSKTNKTAFLLCLTIMGLRTATGQQGWKERIALRKEMQNDWQQPHKMSTLSLLMLL